MGQKEIVQLMLLDTTHDVLYRSCLCQHIMNIMYFLTSKAKDLVEVQNCKCAFVTDHVRSTRDSNVFRGVTVCVCLSPARSGLEGEGTLSTPPPPG